MLCGASSLARCTVTMAARTAALVEEVPPVNQSVASVDNDSSPEEDAAARLIHYPRSATVFAATASIIFIIVGILGELLVFVIVKFFAPSSP